MNIPFDSESWRLCFLINLFLGYGEGVSGLPGSCALATHKSNNVNFGSYLTV